MAKKALKSNVAENNIPFTGINTDNIQGLYSTLFRAIEIAKLGNYSITVSYDRDYNNAGSDYETIKGLCKGFFENFTENGNIKIEISKPTVVFYNCYKFTDITDRIEKAKEVNVKDEICHSSKALIKAATIKLNLSLSQIDGIYNIAKTIAKLDLSENIEVQHIAEAIHYSYETAEINAEKSIINFDDAIFVKVGMFDNDTLDKAIQYLESLKK